MNILISWASWFLWKYLKERFIKDWYNVSTLNRNDFKLNKNKFKEKFENIDIIINLAWSPIIKRWSKNYKKILLSSRIKTTKKIVDTINLLDIKPKLFINASAVWIYKQNITNDEYTNNFDESFLWNIVKKWEFEANKSEIRIVISRFWIILWKWWFLSKILPIFKLWIGWKIWNWNFTMNFVDIEDIYRFYKFSIENKNIKWTFNLSSINIKNKDFTKILWKIIKRPTIFPVPKLALQLLYSECSKVIFSDMEVIPKKTKETWFKFNSNKLENIIKKYL